MTRRLTFIFSLGAALAFPAIASANCGTIEGSFSVTCEQGVQVFRHNALSGVPRGISQAEASVRSAEIRANTDRLRIESQERADLRATRDYVNGSSCRTIFARGFLIAIAAVSPTLSALAMVEASAAVLSMAAVL